MNQLCSIYENYFIWWMLLNALIWYSNAWKVLMQSDMSLRQWSSSKKGTVISQFEIEKLLAYYQHTKYAQLCRINYRSHSIDLLSDLWSSLEAFDNISKNKISLTDAVLLKLQFLHRNRKCAKLMDFSELSSIWPNRLKSKMAHKMIFTCYLWQFSKSVVIFLEM